MDISPIQCVCVVFWYQKRVICTFIETGSCSTCGAIVCMADLLSTHVLVTNCLKLNTEHSGNCWSFDTGLNPMLNTACFKIYVKNSHLIKYQHFYFTFYFTK